MTLFAFYGTFTSGQPGHGNLAGARLIERARTASRYRLYIADGMWPALGPAENGVEIECEVYEADEELLTHLAELEPPGWNRRPLALVDGRTVEAFIADAALTARGEDISHHGSWAAFRTWLAASRRRRLPAEVRTKRLRLRQWRDDDAEPLAEIYAQPEYREHMPSRTLDETRAQVERFHRLWAEEGLSHWAAEDLASGRLIGRIGLLRHHDWPLEPSPVEVGWTLHRDWWGRGFATEGGRACVDLWRSDLVDDPRILSITTLDNVRSQAVMCRLGFTKRGTAFWHGLNVVWYALDRDD